MVISSLGCGGSASTAPPAAPQATPATPPASQPSETPPDFAAGAEQGDADHGGAVRKPATDEAAAPGPFRALTRDEINAAVEAAVERVRAGADKDAAMACTPLPVTTPAELARAAECFGAAGHVGLAIRFWESVRKRGAEKEREEAESKLGPLWESAGRYQDAARSYANFGKTFGRHDAAREALIRATCIWRQLGDEKNAEQTFAHLRRMNSRIKTVDYAACATRSDRSRYRRTKR